ncbi:MAG: hypothetical protein ACRDTC_13330 [Pseudonocardiaceae bacterium]
MFKLLQERQLDFCGDLSKVPFPTLLSDFEVPEYKTYISVPVATSAEIFGLLTIDALNEGDLTIQHQIEMSLLSQQLGLVLGCAATRKPQGKATSVEGRNPTNPTASEDGKISSHDL